MLLAVTALLTVCLIGQNHAEGERRIVGGLFETIDYLPWLASYGTLCGGTIMSKSYVLTAASCGIQAFVKVGSTTLRPYDGEVIMINVHIPHPKYQKGKRDWDYMMLKLVRDIKFGSRAQPVPFYSGPEVDEGTMVTLAGYGRTHADVASGHHSMTWAELPVMKQSDCKKANPKFPLNKDMFCAGYEVGTIGACLEDTGNPVTVDNELVAIVIMAEACGREGQADIYANVTVVKQWIEHLIEEIVPPPRSCGEPSRRCHCQYPDWDHI